DGLHRDHLRRAVGSGHFRRASQCLDLGRAGSDAHGAGAGDAAWAGLRNQELGTRTSCFLNPGSWLLCKRRLRSREPGDWDAVRRAGNVIQPDLAAESDRSRIAAMLSADAELDIRARRSAPFGGDLHQFADAATVDADERVFGDDPGTLIGLQKTAGIVAAEAEHCL